MTYIRVNVIGNGTFGIVTRVVDATGTHFAMKTLNTASSPTLDPNMLLRRFVREVRQQGGIDHANIVKIVFHDLQVNPPFYVMPLADGSLHDELQADPSLGGKPRTRRDYRYILERYLPDWKTRLITDITKEMVGARHVKIATENGPCTANKVMRLLRALFNYAQATFDVCPINPVLYLTHVKAWYKETRRRTYIKPSELKPWWSAVEGLENDTYRDFLKVALFTGLRRSEAARLKWADIDFRERTFTIAETKNGDPLSYSVMC